MCELDDYKNLLVNIEDFEIDKDYILKIHNNTEYNKIIIDYYKRLYEESRVIDDLSIDIHKNNNRVSNIVEFHDTYVLKNRGYKNVHNISVNRISQIGKCNTFWAMNVYDYSQIKDFVSTNLCRDKFCNNCKKVTQAARMSRYIPELEPFKQKLYHLTLTIPNVPGKDLKTTIKQMSSAFQRFVRYLSLRSKLSFLNLSQYGYLGAVRSLEITFKEDSYHPHYHIALVLDENVDLEQKYKNSYSTDHFLNRGDRLFSTLEIIIQKLWYLCYNDITVSSQNFNNLELGYSCLIERFNEDDYAELFKYMTKETDESKNVLTYENFKTLYFATYNLKQIQGYGCLYRICDKDLSEEIEEIYTSIKSFLEDDELARFKVERPIELLNDNAYKVISRKKIYQYLKCLDE